MSFLFYQKITFLLYVYTLGLTIITGIVLLYPSYFKLNPNLMRAIFSTHIISMFFVFLIFIYHILINIRKWQISPFRTIFVDGKVSLAYVTKNNKQWYNELTQAKQEVKVIQSSEEEKIAFNILEMIGIVPNEKQLQEGSELVKNLNKEEYERVKELVE